MIRIGDVVWTGDDARKLAAEIDYHGGLILPPGTRVEIVGFPEEPPRAIEPFACDEAPELPPGFYCNA